MAKTKLLADIGTLSEALMGKINAASSRLLTASSIGAADWDALSEINTDLGKLDLAIGKLEQRIHSWDGSTKLRDIFKKKAPLAQARLDAIDKAKVIRAEAAFIHAMVADVIAEMQRIAKH